MVLGGQLGGGAWSLLEVADGHQADGVAAGVGVEWGQRRKGSTRGRGRAVLHCADEKLTAAEKLIRSLTWFSTH